MSGNHLPINTGSNSSWDPGTAVAKIFKGAFYLGEVTEVIEDVNKKGKKIKWWRIKYEDGDEEDLDEKEMKSARKLYVSAARSKISNS